MRRALSSLLLASLLLQPVTADAGSAWPRGAGNTFASVSWSTWGDIVGYSRAIQEPWIEPPILEQTEEIGLFAEYGVTDRVTFGVDHHHRQGDGIGATIWFLRSNIGSLEWPDKISVEIGAGPTKDFRLVDDTALRLGFGWGRGFETPWGGAWADIDAKFTTFAETDPYFYKVDTTLGISPSEKSMWYLQVQSGALEGFPTYTRLVPTYVRRLGYGISLESALLWGVKNDEAQGVKISTWFEF